MLPCFHCRAPLYKSTESRGGEHVTQLTSCKGTTRSCHSASAILSESRQMTSKHQRHVTLSAGEECTLSGSGLVQITLLAGVVDIAGVLLEASQSYIFYLSVAQRALILFTLEGGSVNVSSELSIEIHKADTGAAGLVQLVRRTLVSLSSSKVLVIGNAHGGKTLSAHTLVNSLHRYGADSNTGTELKVCLVDLNCETNSIFSPGCVSAVVLPQKQVPLWLGRTACPTFLPLSWYTGTAVRPAAHDVGMFLHFCEQLNETAIPFFHETAASMNTHVVVDCPSPLEDLKEGVFYKKLIELFCPTHVVIVGNREDPSNSWSTFLQEDVQRVLPECDFVFTGPVTHPCTQVPKPLLMEEYFTGTPFTPLGCSKVVVPSQALLFVQYGGPEQGRAPVATRVLPNRGWRNLVAALSHAETLEEVPLAPIAGLVVIACVDEEYDEVALVIPAGEENLLRRIVVVPHMVDGEILSLTDTQAAAVEESVV